MTISTPHIQILMLSICKNKTNEEKQQQQQQQQQQQNPQT